MAVSNCNPTPTDYTNFASKDTNRIVGKIAEVLIRKSPWMNVIGGGVLENVSDTVRSIIQEQAVVTSSLKAPVFVADITTCGLIPSADQVGTTEYSYVLETLRGRGPRVCVKDTRTAFTGSYINAQQSMERGVLKIMNADVRYQLYSKSGLKASINNTVGFSTMLNGDSQAISVNFPALAPNAQVSFKWLLKLASTLRETFLVNPFESDTGTMFKFIGSWDIIESFRNELNVKADLVALTTGGYKLGEKSIDGYAFEGPYRNIAFAIDNQPLRFNTTVAGQPVLIEPEISVVTNGKGVAARINPAWTQANYEVGFLIGADSFFRLTPKQYTGEGTFKFAPQMWMGELEWFYQRDNDCNMYGDFGQHLYQIMRAYRPERPHAIVPIIYQRCSQDYALPTCVSSATGL